MLTVKIPSKQLKEIAKVINETKTSVGAETAIAINKTGKKTVTFASRTIRQVAAVKSAILKKTIRQKNKASLNKPVAKIGFWDGYKIPLKYFTSRTAKKGVSYKYRKSDGMTIHPTAFTVDKWGGYYERISKERGPIRTAYGLSPGDFFKETGVVEKSKQFAQKQLKIELIERVRFLTLKQQGKLKGKQRR